MTEQRAKVNELVLSNNIFVQLFWSSFGSFFSVLPNRRLSDTVNIQTDFESKMEVFAQIMNGF